MIYFEKKNRLSLKFDNKHLPLSNRNADSPEAVHTALITMVTQCVGTLIAVKL